jgi:hypothetical protein
MQRDGRGEKTSVLRIGPAKVLHDSQITKDDRYRKNTYRGAAFLRCGFSVTFLSFHLLCGEINHKDRPFSKDVENRLTEQDSLETLTKVLAEKA